MRYKVLGFHLTGSNSGLSTINEQYSILDKVIPGLIEVNSDGYIKSLKNSPIILEKMGKGKVIPMIQNAGLDSRISNQIIVDREAIANFNDNVISYLKTMGYREVCLDIEGVKYSNKIDYTEFIKRVSDELHQEEYSLSIAIPAKSENNQDSTWSGAYDYQVLGNIVDRIIIMAYDFHWPGGPPGPIAPLPWVQDVIDYALIEIPLEKLYLALGLYGYDWSLINEEKAKGLVFQQVIEIASKYSTKIEWDQESQSPYLKYTHNEIEHEIWFENKQSIAKKLKLVEDFQLAGVVFWRLGQEDPAIWGLLG